MKRLKLSIIGNSGTGKTALVRTFLADSAADFPRNYSMTNQAEVSAKRFQMDDNAAQQTDPVEIMLFDLGGNEIFREYLPKICHGSNCTLITIDVSDPQALREAERWVEIASLIHNRRQPAPVIIVGTKIDLPRALKRDQVYAFATERGLKYFECSALSNTGVKQLFIKATELAA